MIRKRIFIPLISALIAAILLLSPIAIPSIGQPLGQLLHPSGNPFAHTFSDTKDIRTATYVVAASDSEHRYMADYVCDGVEQELVICDCETAWNSRQGANVVCTADPDHKVGTYSAKLAVADAAGTGLIATKDFTASDLSDHRSIKLWLKCSIDTPPALKLHFSSTADCGGTPNEEEIIIPSLAADTWTQLAILLANPASDTAIVSVGIEQLADLGAFDLYVDDVKQIWSDDVEIQAAIDALPATGGEVLLLDGTYYITDSLVLDSYQTLRGCGRATCLTSGSRLSMITATGADGSEKQGILITDLFIPATALALNGILWTYVDHSRISNMQFGVAGIKLVTCDSNTLIGNTCSENVGMGIHLDYSCNNIITDNICYDNEDGIGVFNSSNYNIIISNLCFVNGHSGICIEDSLGNTITSNTCKGNFMRGIFLGSANNSIVSGNSCLKNSQGTDNKYGNIHLFGDSDYNLITGNVCRKASVSTTLSGAHSATDTTLLLADATGFRIGEGITIDPGGANEETHKITDISDNTVTIEDGLTNDQIDGEEVIVPRTKYGIDISDDACDRNCLIGNDLYDSGETGDLNDVPTTNPTLKHDNRNLAGTGWLPEV